MGPGSFLGQTRDLYDKISFYTKNRELTYADRRAGGHSVHRPVMTSHDQVYGFQRRQFALRPA